MSSTTTGTFYQQTAACVAAWWIIASIGAQKPLHTLTEGSVVTVSTWLPKRFILLLQRFRPIIFNLETIGLSLAVALHQYDNVRVTAAILFTLYHITESSQTNRHGEYPLLYAMWAMCLPDPIYGQACTWGIAIHYILSAGYAKLIVGGFSEISGAPLWMRPSTMETYLTCYQQAGNTMARPLLPMLSEFISTSKFLTSLIGFAVLLLELIIIPATLLQAPEARIVASYGIVLLHVGIAFVMSFKVGLVFLTSIPVCLYGFACPAAVGSGPWMVACLVGLGPTVLTRYLMPVPENWPLSPVSLFMWNGKIAQRLLGLLMTGDTRMVLTTAKVASDELVGLRVLHHGELAEKYEDVVHDCILRTIGFTMIHGGEAVLEAVHALEYDTAIDGMATKELLHRTWAWLTLDRRLVEAHTGDDLTRVFLVRIDESTRVSEVIM